MIYLPNGCSCSDLSVFPKNWKTSKASIKIKWYISYRFYDPSARGRYPNGKQIQIKGVNSYKDLRQRRDAIQALLTNELKILQEDGYNPITGRSLIETEQVYEIHPETPFLEALSQVHFSLKRDQTTLRDIKSVLKGVKNAAIALKLHYLTIAEVRRKHLKIILDYCPNIIERWSSKRFNKYKSYLSMLFSELVELETIETNPVKEISKQKTTKNVRDTLTMDERRKINIFLKSRYYEFWRFIQIFFHSGSRESELLLMKVIDVDIANQRFKVIVEKGKENFEIWRPIKTIALPLWEEIVSEASNEHYVFSKGLIPGAKSINPAQLTRRWREHVKIKLGIEPDLYSLKHSNLDETAAALSIEDAAKMAAHTTIRTTRTYTVNEAKRQDERLKSLNNAFAV